MKLNQHLSSPSSKKGDSLISVSNIPILININTIYYNYKSHISTTYTLQWPHAKFLPQLYTTELNQLSISIKGFRGPYKGQGPRNQTIWRPLLPSLHFGTRKPKLQFFPIWHLDFPQTLPYTSTNTHLH